MKRYALTLGIAILTFCISSKVSAQEAQQAAAFTPDYKLALGIRFSNSIPTLNTSFSAKYFVTNRSAIEGLISFGNRFGIGGLLEIHNSFNTQGLTWFYGGGAYIGFQDNNSYVGPTGVIGLDYKFPNVPVNLSLDWKPELDIVPKINFVPEAFGLTVRFVVK
jgi:hypothetical protein